MTVPDADLLNLALHDPMRVAEIALTEAGGPEPSETRAEMFRLAAANLAIRHLVRLGCDQDAVFRNFETRPWTAQFVYDPDDEEITVAITWLDNANPPEMRPPT